MFSRMSFALLALVALTSLICAPRHAGARNELMVKIMTLLFDNEFVKIDSDRGQVSLLLMFGLDTGFRFAYMQEGEVSTCITTYVASGSKVSYADLSCDGAPERKRIGE